MSKLEELQKAFDDAFDIYDVWAAWASYGDTYAAACLAYKKARQELIAYKKEHGL